MGRIVTGLIGFLALAVQPSAAWAEDFSFRAERILGSSYEITVRAENEAAAAQANEAALAEVARLENILSTWKQDSEISRLNASTSLVASPELYAFLSECEAVRAELSNAFSCRIGRLIAAWKAAQDSGEAPDEAKLQTLAETIAAAPVRFDDATRRIERPDSVIFAVDAMAKGWILDRAAEKALAIGVTGLVLNIGGDIRVAGDVSGNAPKVGVAAPGAADNETPLEVIAVGAGGVASSGAGMRDMKVGARTYSYIIDPRTGLPQTGTSVTAVVAPTAAVADAYATAFSVLGVGQSMLAGNRKPGLEAVIITAGGGRFVSNGWSSLIAPVEKVSAEAAGIENPWPDGFSLGIEYEVPQVNVADYQAPYVAIWVTDEKKKLVRSLLMLGNRPRWVEENYMFWRRYGRKHPALVDTLARPTRAPGRYELAWDGRDETGVPVPQGTYLLHIEASREHGGHTYLSRELTLAGGALDEIIPAEGEIGEVLVHFGTGMADR